MPLVVAPTLQDVYTLLRAFVISVVPAGTEVIQGLENRASMPTPPTPTPAGWGFVCMTATVLRGHRTPQESWDISDPDPVAISIEQGILVRVQLDCYGPVSADWAVMLTALLRTDYACRVLAPVAPLYADDPVQAALVNGEEQYEERWIVGANLQYNPIVSTPMEFANTAAVTTINVDERYPP